MLRKRRGEERRKHYCINCRTMDNITLSSPFNIVMVVPSATSSMEMNLLHLRQIMVPRRTRSRRKKIGFRFSRTVLFFTFSLFPIFLWRLRLIATMRPSVRLRAQKKTKMGVEKTTSNVSAAPASLAPGFKCHLGLYRLSRSVRGLLGFVVSLRLLVVP